MIEREEQWNLDRIRENERTIGNLLEQNAALGKRLDGQAEHIGSPWEESKQVDRLSLRVTRLRNVYSACLVELIKRVAALEGGGQVMGESYTDTLNDLFPWGCETESEVITELVRRLDALADHISNLECGLRLQMERQGALAKRVARLEKWVKRLENAIVYNYKDATDEREVLAERIEKLGVYARCQALGQYKLIERVDSLWSGPRAGRRGSATLNSKNGCAEAGPLSTMRRQRTPAI